MNNKFGFTLGEILVTLAIIGVVSALTIPSTINNTQKKALAVQLQKTINDITNATDLHTTDENKNSFSSTSGYAYLNKFVEENFKVLKSCSSASGCFADVNYRSLDNSQNKSFSCAGGAYLLANSAAICMSKSGTQVVVVTDVNGKKGPNTGGRDMFTFKLDNKTGDIVSSYSSSNCKGSAYGEGCYELLAEENNWSMDY